MFNLKAKSQTKFNDKVWFQLTGYGMHWLKEMVADYRKTAEEDLKQRLFPDHVQSTIEWNVAQTYPVPDESGWCEMSLKNFIFFSSAALEYDIEMVEHTDDFDIMFEGMGIYFRDPRK